MANAAPAGGPEPLWILDTSAVLHADWSHRAHACIAPPGVAAEFSPGGRTYAKWQRLLAAGLTVRAPDEAALVRVEQEALRLGETGLSRADLEVAALAVGEEAAGGRVVVVSDDYALQNLLARMGLEFQAALARGITETRTYRLRCSGCARWFDPGAHHEEGGACPVCGSPLRRRRWKG